MKATTKLDTTSIVKKVSREFFMNAMDTKTKAIPSKKDYKRKTKHKNKIDY